MNCSTPIPLNLLGSVLQGPPGEVKKLTEVHPQNFGGYWDGVREDTDAVRKAHQYANLHGKRVSYEGLPFVTIDANAKIPVNTNVDFCGAQLKILNGIVETPSYSTHRIAFVVEDPNTPLQSITLNKSLCDLTPNARKPFGSQRDGFAGYYLVETDYKILNRLRTGTENYKQSLCLDSEGATALGLGADMTSATSVTVKYRANPKKFIEIKNFVTDPNEYNNQILFDVQRSLAVIHKHKLIDAAPSGRPDICALYRLSDVNEPWLVGIHGPSRSSPDIGGSSLGTYVINPEGVTNALFDRLTLTGSKSVIGSNHVNGLKVQNSTLIRLDVHSSGFNIEAESVNFLDRGIGIGWGGGYIRAKKCKLKSNVYPIISDREDYAGTWFSCTMEAIGCEVDSYASRRQAIIELSSFKVTGTSPGVGNLLTPTYMPDVITVKDCYRINATLAGNLVTQGVRIPVLEGAVVYAPRIVNIVNIDGALAGNARFGNRIDLRAMRPHRSGNKSVITISDCEGADSAPNQSFQTEGLTLTTGSSNGLTASTACRFDLDIDGMDAVCVETGCTQGRIHISNSSISRVALTSDDTTRQALFIGAGCSAVTPFLRGSETQAPIGYPAGVTPTVYTPTAIMGLHITGDFALPSASALQGITIRVGANVTLPNTVTAAQAFTGWKLNQFQ